MGVVLDPNWSQTGYGLGFGTSSGISSSPVLRLIFVWYPQHIMYLTQTGARRSINSVPRLVSDSPGAEYRYRYWTRHEDPIPDQTGPRNVTGLGLVPRGIDLGTRSGFGNTSGVGSVPHLVLVLVQYHPHPYYLPDQTSLIPYPNGYHPQSYYVPDPNQCQTWHQFCTPSGTELCLWELSGAEFRYRY